MDKILTIIPIYNKEEFLKGAIESVLQQTHKNVELVLVDDCSQDTSLEIAKSYEHLPNVTVLQNPENKGCYYSINKGMDVFSDKEWDYFTIHGADDLSDVKRFETLLKGFQQNPNLLGMRTTYVRVDRQHQPLPTRDGSRIDIHPGVGIAIYRRKAFDKLGYYDNTRFSGDSDYWFRAIQYCNTTDDVVADSHDVLYMAISHEDNLTKKYSFDTDRPKYVDKIEKEITQMIEKNNFYRNKFK